MRQKRIWQKAADELGGHVYVYGNNYFGFGVKVKLQENVEIGQNLERKINEVIQQDYKDLFFRHFVDKEKNFCF